jgi:hypothetical protein
MLFKETIAIYSENHTKHINTKLRVVIVQAGGTYTTGLQRVNIRQHLNFAIA